MTCWGKWNATWHFISMLFCWCLSAVETLIEQLHEACDVQLFIGVKTSSTEEGMIAFTRALLCMSLRHGSDMGTGADCGRSSQCLCWVYPSTFLNRPRSGSPRRLYSNLSCHIKDCQNAICSLNFLRGKTKLYSFGTHAYQTERPVPKRFGINVYPYPSLKWSTKMVHFFSVTA